MMAWQRRVIGAASILAGGTTLVGVSGLVALACHFVDELSRPGVTLAADSPEIDWKMPEAGPEPPAERRRTLSFRAPGGPLLRGEFWAQPQPAPTMVICHGYRVDRAMLRPVAALEYQEGVNVLLFDFRGHGESAMVPISGGNAETRDLMAALELAAAQPETIPGKLLIHGFSMGAAVALLVAPQCGVAGIIADSPYARLDDILCRLVLWQLTTETAGWAPAFRWLRAGFPALAQVMFLASDLIFRVRFRSALRARTDLRFRPVTRISRKAASRRRALLPLLWAKRSNGAPRPETQSESPAAQPVPVLLIHAQGDPFIPVTHARQIEAAAKAAQAPIELHLADCASHCGAYGHDPEHYTTLVREFIARVCANAQTAQAGQAA
jgi:alpha-beta hydrolase superfamily lysophospholipase